MKTSRLFMVVVLVAFVYISLPAAHSLAQTGGIDSSQPINLSRSGGTLDPIAAVDSTGVIHVAWKDAEDRFFYSRTTREGWTAPRWIDYPFSPADISYNVPAPRLVAGLSGRLTMFWLNEVASLRSSAISAESFGATTGWSKPILVARSVEAYDMEMDSRGFYHLAYVQSADYPPANAGIYYTASRDYGASWDVPILISSSSYFIRRGEELNSTNNTLDLTVSTVEGRTAVFITYDNIARKRVTFARSLFDGLRWDEPVEIDGPATQGSSTIPFQIKVAANQENIVLAWQAGQPEGVCTNYYLISRDAGVTWSERQRFNVPYVECPDEKTLTTVGEYTLLSDTIKGQTYYSAWNGKEWSQAQARTELFNFVDPETLNKTKLECKVPVLLSPQDLAVVGCDRGQGRDIWLVRQSLADIGAWFSDIAGWRVVEKMQSTKNHIANLHIVADNQEGIHALWSQVEDPGLVGAGSEATLLTNDAIYYSHWNGQEWSKPLPIHSGLENSVGKMAVEIGQSGRIALIWKDEVARKLFYSWAEANRASSALEWAVPVSLPVDDTTADMPDLALDPAGMVYAVYSLPINENRGIYLMSSQDGGKNWTEPEKILDGVESGVEVVESPVLSIGLDGSMHLLVGDGVLNSKGGMNRLLYMKSTDKGLTWTQPESISSRLVKHYRLLATGKTTVHRIWQEEGEEGDAIYHQLSVDGGMTWSRVNQVLSATEKFWLGDVVADKAGQIHLFQAFNDAQRYQNIIYWLWDGSDWSEIDNFVTGQTALEGEFEIDGAMNLKGELMTITLRGITDLSTQTQEYILMYTARMTKLPAGEVTPVALMPLITATPLIQIASTETPEPTPTTDLSTLSEPQTDQGGMGTVVAVSIALTIVVIALALGVVFVRSKKNQ